jgi:hypothetical protein
VEKDRNLDQKWIEWSTFFGAHRLEVYELTQPDYNSENLTHWKGLNLFWQRLNAQVCLPVPLFKGQVLGIPCILKEIRMSVSGLGRQWKRKCKHHPFIILEVTDLQRGSSSMECVCFFKSGFLFLLPVL